MALYNKSSPYYNTKYDKGYLDVISYRDIIAEADDVYYKIAKTYEYRPDLLSQYLYKTPDYWWVFAVRNSSIIKDPVFDFVAGTNIFIPKLSNIKQSLGST